MVGEHLDVSSDLPPRKSVQPPRARPFVGIHFACCHVYGRVYPNPEGTRYQGHCPKCLRKISLQIGPHGTATRFFSAS